jgi:hypothetical protein
METLINTIQTELKKIAKIKMIEEEEGQFDDKITLQLPALLYDVVGFGSSQNGELQQMTNVQIIIRIAFKKEYQYKFEVIDDIELTMSRLNGSHFGRAILTEMKRELTEDVKIYNMVFDCPMKRSSSRRKYTTTPKPKP